MIIVISPSKTLDFSGEISGGYTIPDFLDKSEELISVLRKLPAAKIASLMDISEKLSKLNWQRYKDFSVPFTPANARQALYAFKGDVYEGLAAHEFSKDDAQYAQSHLRIISGLYGLLRPLDLIQPYRLEMGTKLANKNGRNLYKFWGDQITEKLNEVLQGGVLVNLASEKYFKAVNKKLLQGKIITPIFKEKKGKDYKIVSFYAKKARGLMAAYIIKNRVEAAEDIAHFNESGYKFNKALSGADEFVFTR